MYDVNLVLEYNVVSSSSTVLVKDVIDRVSLKNNFMKECDIV